MRCSIPALFGFSSNATSTASTPTAIPPLDAAAPVHVETATFALG
jgi:hypothetical protein